MANPQLCLRLMGLVLLFTIVALQGVSSASSALHKILKSSDGPEGSRPEASVVVPPSKAQQFLAKLRRPKRQVWDRSRPDVQQWIQQFMYMGFDEQRLEADLSYWMDHARSHDQGRQHHYDENAPVGPRDHTSYRHGANVNYDYY
ncbi:augurin-A [Eucyclogobius newberryi]|uniref:augurin-A n=1 Tax=Eucyclogobius newberryi TaxID=166745 RepID=UPI003B5C6B06